MSTTEPRRRSTDSWLGKLGWFWQNLVPVVAIGLAVWSVAIAADSQSVANRESEVRTSQFCNLTLATHNDKIKRYQTTVEYLRSPAGKQKTLFNDYVARVSVPQTRVELRREAQLIPPVCRSSK